MDKEIYLDNSATTKPFDEVAEYTSHIMKTCYGNPSSLHGLGLRAEKELNKARLRISETLFCKPEEIIFTSGGTEANNIAIKGYLSANSKKNGKIITTRIEHPSVMEVLKTLECDKRKIEYIPVDKNGVMDTEYLKNVIKPDTLLICIILINNETGSIQPIAEICKIRDNLCPQAVIHADAVQAFGKIEINPEKIGIDMLSISAHKIHGPKGTGALYKRKGLRVSPVFNGGGQEISLRSGTENVSGIAGFGLAAEIYFKEMNLRYKKVYHLMKLFLAMLKEKQIEHYILSPEDASPFILNLSFPKLPSEVILHHLEEYNIYVSTGSACSSRKKRRSSVLEALGIEGWLIDSSIRFSFSGFNKEEEIINTVEALIHILKLSTKL